MKTNLRILIKTFYMTKMIVFLLCYVSFFADWRGASLEEGCRGCAHPTSIGDLRLSKINSIVHKRKEKKGKQKKDMRWGWSHFLVHPLLRKILDPPYSL